MKWAVLSDIHANLEALEAVLADIREQGVARICCQPVSQQRRRQNPCSRFERCLLAVTRHPASGAVDSNALRSHAREHVVIPKSLRLVDDF